jgi:hypothetical protein
MPDPAYGQTDVMHDPNYLAALLRRGPRDPQAQMAERQLEQLRFEEAHRQQLGEFEQRAEALRQQRETESARRGEAASEMEENRRARLQLATAAEEDRRSAAVDRLLGTSGLLEEQFGKQAPGIRKALVQQQLARSGVGPITIPPDPQAVEMARKAGKPVPQPTTIGGAPQPTAAAGQPSYEHEWVDPSGFLHGPMVHQEGPATIAPAEGQTLRELMAQGTMPPGYHVEGTGGNRYTYAKNPDTAAVPRMTGRVEYDPATRANYGVTAEGNRVVIGGGDPSVGALEGRGFVAGPTETRGGQRGSMVRDVREGGSFWAPSAMIARHPNWQQPLSPERSVAQAFAPENIRQGMGAPATGPLSPQRPAAPFAPPMSTTAAGGVNPYEPAVPGGGSVGGQALRGFANWMAQPPTGVPTGTTPETQPAFAGGRSALGALAAQFAPGALAQNPAAPNSPAQNPPPIRQPVPSPPPTQ